VLGIERYGLCARKGKGTASKRTEELYKEEEEEIFQIMCIVISVLWLALQK